MLGKGKYRHKNEGQSSLYKSDAALEKCINKIDSSCAKIVDTIKTFSAIATRRIKDSNNPYHTELINSLENICFRSLEMVNELKKFEALKQASTENKFSSILGSTKTHSVSHALKEFEKDAKIFLDAVQLLSKNNQGEAVKTLLQAIEDQKKQIDEYDLLEFSNYYETLQDQNIKDKDGKVSIAFSGINSLEEMASSIVRFCLLGPFSAKRKSMVEFADAASAVRFVESTSPPPTKKQATERIDNFQHSKASNKQKGNYGEIIAHEYMTTDSNVKEKYDLVSITGEGPAHINEKLKQGIDGIYFNRKAPPPPIYVIVEVKYNTSQPGKTQDGKQMSDSWISRSKRLEKLLGKKKARKIKFALLSGKVEKVLCHVSKKGDVSCLKLKNTPLIEEFDDIGVLTARTFETTIIKGQVWP